MTTKFDLSVLIGRFQPWHNGHLQIAKSGLDTADRMLLLIGSSNIARTTRNPFTYNERAEMISHSLFDAGLLDRVEIAPLPDNPYDNAAWSTTVQEKVAQEIAILSRQDSFPTHPKIAITGHNRDQSSFYLKKFPQWEFSPPVTALLHLNATALRTALFTGLVPTDPAPDSPFGWLSPSTLEFLRKFEKRDVFLDLAGEFQFENQYRKKWGPGPFQTVDNVVIQSGHVLVVQRKSRPGRGLYAVPGGHLNLDESLDEGAVRELFEETKLYHADCNNAWGTTSEENHFEYMKERLWPHYRARRRFDNPYRSTRARVITEAFLFKLPDAVEFPDVVGSDDAERAFWLPLSEMKPTDFFEDHFFIIKKMLGYLS